MNTRTETIIKNQRETISGLERKIASYEKYEVAIDQIFSLLEQYGMGSRSSYILTDIPTIIALRFQELNEYRTGKTIIQDENKWLRSLIERYMSGDIDSNDMSLKKTKQP